MLSLSRLTFFVSTDAAVMARLREDLFLSLVVNDVLSLRDTFLDDSYTGLRLLQLASLFVII